MKNQTKKLTTLAMMATFALILSYVESRIPALVAIPGVKVGLDALATRINEILAKPVDEILGLLPNLLCAIEYNQILPKIKNVKLDFLIDLFGGISVYKLPVWDMFLKDMLADLGLDLEHGFAGVIDMLLSATRVNKDYYDAEFEEAVMKSVLTSKVMRFIRDAADVTVVE